MTQFVSERTKQLTSFPEPVRVISDRIQGEMEIKKEKSFIVFALSAQTNSKEIACFFLRCYVQITLKREGYMIKND